LWDEQCDTLIFAEKKDPAQAVPAVKAATVEKLVEWLTFSKNTGHDYTATFLLTYRTFMTTEELLEQLIARYRDPQVSEILPGYEITSIERQTVEQMQHIVRLRYVFLSFIYFDFIPIG
jgi:son of sevenless-like protein